MTHRSETRSRLGPDGPGWTFFRQWLKNPLAIAAISPSSRQLARQMVAELPPETRRVIELGGGTGVFTRALLEHGIAPADLMVLELNEELHHHLRRRFADACVVCADARDLPDVARRVGYLDAGLADAVISGLGLLRCRVRFSSRSVCSFRHAAAGRRLIHSPTARHRRLSKEVLAELDLSARRRQFAWWNMPPATVTCIPASLEGGESAPMR